MKSKFWLLCSLWLGVASVTSGAEDDYPILFVTQVPQPNDFITIGSTFGNHRSSIGSVPRGGDLWIRYPDGTLKNLTAAAGYGDDGEQGVNAIAVRDPEVHWTAEKAIFSMLIGAPAAQYQQISVRWQLYEITGLGVGETPVITLVPNQPSNFNNISPCYDSNDHIIFTSDRPRNGELHLYPQLDEYEESPTVSGLWSLNPANGDLFLMEHSPSGSFGPFVDSYGRVIFSRWDHLQRDQQADGDAINGNPGGVYGTFDFSDESASATMLYDVREESFPEPRSIRTDLLAPNENGLRFNSFFPWMIRQDGTEMEMLNHVGRHELADFFTRSFTDDPELEDFNAPAGRLSLVSAMQLSEDPTTLGSYVGTEAPEFQTHAAGLLFRINGGPSVNPEDMVVEYLTHPDTGTPSNSPSSDHSGLYRDPIRLANGTYLSVHTAETRADANTGTGNAIGSRYDFRLRELATASNGYLEPDGAPITGSGITESIEWWSPDVKLTYNGLLWELQPVEVRPRTTPPFTGEPDYLPPPEMQMFTSSDSSLINLRSYLRSQNLAMLVMRNVTTRDDADKQQPYHLRVDGDTATPPGATGKQIYDVKYLQFYQGDQLRGIGLQQPADTPRAGRRVLARPMHEGSVLNASDSSAPPGAVTIAPDGSVAAIVPARRALSWQLIADDGTPVVRERFWLSFQPGEMRSCTSCHGLNRQDQAGRNTPTNPPQALLPLLEAWKLATPPLDSRITKVELQSNGDVDISMIGPLGVSVALEQSTNLVDWTQIATVVMTNSTVVETHAHQVDAQPADRCFYRLVTP